MAKRKTVKKKTATKKSAPRKGAMSDEERRELIGEAVLIAEAAREIETLDCIAYMTWLYTREETDEWAERGARAAMKFANFGWSVYNSMGANHVDWDATSETILEKLKQFGQRK